MTGPVSRDDLLSARLDDRERVDVPGGYVLIRPVTRAQALQIRGAGRDAAKQEPWILHFGLADPELSLEDAHKWIETAGAGVIQRLTVAIARLSGMDTDAGKERTKSPARKR